MFSICRIIFYVFNAEQFEAGLFPLLKSFLAGLIFDTSAIAYLFSPFILMHLIPLPFRSHERYQSILRVLFVVIVFVAVLLNLIDTGYYPFNGKRSGVELFSLSHDIGDQAFSYAFSYWYLLLILIAITWSAWKFYPSQKFEYERFSFKVFILDILQLIVFSGLSVLGARGGTGLKPIANFDAARYADVNLMAVTLNTPFQMLVTSQFKDIEEKKWFTEDEATEIFNPVHAINDSLFQKKNVVLIIVESLGKEYVGFYNQGKGYTPYLDSICKLSTVYTHAFANGKRSIEGIPSIIASMPSIMPSDYINTRFQTNKLKGIGNYLSSQGYSSSFYHGARNGTMGFDNFIAVTGSGKYMGLDEYPHKDKDFDDNWGIYDEPYLQYTVDEFSSMQQPFFSVVFTLSSHHPYSIPAVYKGKFPKGTLPIHESVGYADYALNEFFKSASKTKWYKNTVFIITADHSAENENPVYQSLQGKYQIPLVVFDPSSQFHTELPTTVQQTDILPMILNQCYKGNYFAFSNYKKAIGEDGFAIQQTAGIYQLIKWPYVLHFDGDRSVAFYNADIDPLLSKNLISQNDLEVKKAEMERFIKAYIQVYNHALISNSTHTD